MSSLPGQLSRFSKDGGGDGITVKLLFFDALWINDVNMRKRRRVRIESMQQTSEIHIESVRKRRNN
jgi:hypothetical protein